MIHSRYFNINKNKRLTCESDKYLRGMFSSCPEDRPVFAQFCGNDPNILLTAALKI